MSKVTKKLSKKIKKTKEAKKEENKERNNIMAIAKITFCLLSIIILICIITNIAEGKYIFTNDTVQISSDEIIAGQAFNRNEDTYYVTFYDFTSTTANLDSTISQLKVASKIYKVNISDGFNKSIKNEESNKGAQSASELKINDVTIIKIENGENVEYTTGYDAVKTYLEKIS